MTLPLKHPYLSLTLLFLVTRAILFSLALLTPSPAYDSSTNLILPWPPSKDYVEDGPRSASAWIMEIMYRLAERLTRWDAIYYVKVAERGYLFEQEWAFGWGFTRVIGWVGRELVKYCPMFDSMRQPYPHVFAGMLVANSSHLASVYVLYSLTKHIFNKDKQLAYISAALHILSPAGLFLAAPYSESLFSFLTFLGYLVYIKSTYNPTVKTSSFVRNVGTLMAGVLFSLATMVRSNGLLNGLVLLYDFLAQLGGFVKDPRVERMVGIVVLGASGLLVAAGLALPQGIAWLDYCTIEGTKTEWCGHTIPSIYLWVQEKYWNVGFLRYWTISNIPLFLLAFPTLTILLYSGSKAVFGTLQPPPPELQSTLYSSYKSSYDQSPYSTFQLIDTHLLRKLALPQVALAAMAIFSYHVQIINRLASGCLLWYWWVAMCVVSEARGVRQSGKDERGGRWTVKWMVVYGLVQAVLFAGFLPPA